jgi:hypothetical protein
MTASAPRSAAEVWRAGLWTAIRALSTITALTTLYFVVPMDRQGKAQPAVAVLAVMTVSGLLGALQVRTILRSRRPTLRAIEALAFTIPLLLLGFASVYFLMSQSDPTAFTEALSRADALYFGVTVFATVGFGDITPVSQSARMVVTGQMIFNLLVLGVGLRVVVGAVQLSRGRQV